MATNMILVPFVQWSEHGVLNGIMRFKTQSRSNPLHTVSSLFITDMLQSIAIQPSLWGYISKSIALCGNGQLWDAMEAFDLAITFSDRDPVTIDLLLLIKVRSLLCS